MNERTHSIESKVVAAAPLFSLCHRLSRDAGWWLEEIIYNMTRPDHKPENRAKEGGKKY